LTHPQEFEATKDNIEDVPNDPTTQYNIGKTQNFPVHVPTFVSQNSCDPGADPAIKVYKFMHTVTGWSIESWHHSLQNFFPKLKTHLLPRIQEIIRKEADSQQQQPFCSHDGLASADIVRAAIARAADMSDFVFLQHDRIYSHKLSRFHFTTYNVQQGTDIINPDTSRCNIMLLANNADLDTLEGSQLDAHPFLYARVLGVYHANIIYTGDSEGMVDYKPRHLEFLWVRWYDVIDPTANLWSKSKLDSLHFPPMNQDDSFGFVDPKDVLRGCHIMPNFAKGLQHPDGRGISCLAKDAKDYKEYYIGR
jgi:hypothetical protein